MRIVGGAPQPTRESNNQQNIRFLLMGTRATLLSLPINKIRLDPLAEQIVNIIRLDSHAGTFVKRTRLDPFAGHCEAALFSMPDVSDERCAYAAPVNSELSSS